MRRHLVLLAKSAIAAAPLGEMQRMADETAAAIKGAAVTFAFTEQGAPSLKDRLDALMGEGASDITLVPLIVPMEPGMTAWLTKAIHRWRGAANRPDIVFRLAPPPTAVAAMAEVITATALLGLAAEPVAVAVDKPLGSVVPDHQVRVLVCQGGPCNDAGAALVWGHLRNEQVRLGLREAASMMSARTSCLGPCNLAPVVQVYPQGVYYGGVDEAGVDRIIAEHLMQGEVVRDLAYEPVPSKQRLRVLPVAGEGADLGPMARPNFPSLAEGSSLATRSFLRQAVQRRDTMPAKSAAQQKAAGAALSAKRGDTPKSKLKGASKSMMSMNEKELDEMASTKRKGKPEHAAKAKP